MTLKKVKEMLQEDKSSSFADLINPFLPAPTQADLAKQALDEHSASAPGEFVFADQALLDMAEQAYRDRQSFTYDPDADGLYRLYKDRYTAKGKQAAEDTMGIAQAMTSGYGNSYAQTLGHQAYNAYLEKLMDVMPQLYELAYEKYRDETDLLRQNAEDLAKQKKEAEEDHTTAQKAHETEEKNLYNRYQDALSRQDKAYTRLAALVKLGYNPTAAELREAGMTRAMANALAKGG